MISPLRLLERQEVGDDLIEFLLRKLHIRHQCAILDRLWIPHPGTQLFRRIWRGPGSQGVTTHEVRQIGTEPSLRSGPGDRVAVDAGSGKKNIPTGLDLSILCAVLLLSSHPTGEIIRLVDDDA